MRGENKRLYLLTIVLVFSVLFVINFVSAWVDCWEFDSGFGGDQTSCEAAGTGVECRWDTPATDPWCSNEEGCCMMRGCMEFDGNQILCESTTDSFNCSWDPYCIHYYPNGSEPAIPGGCHDDFSSGATVWGGMSEGCWNNDGNKLACTSDNTCNWNANDANQNSWCWIKTLGDAQSQNSLATTTDIGCCEQKGCWSYDGNETQCVNNTAFKGLCTWGAKEDDSWCYNDVGCCYQKSCSEIGDETNCTKMKTDLMMPCEWESEACTNGAGGGFMFFNDTDSCFSQGGWWNSSGDCEMPGDGFGGGGFMFAEGAHCWFGDNQASVCGNITGCGYCVSGSGPNGIDNSSSNNICYNKMNGYCEGRVDWDSDIYANANNSRNLQCLDIQIKSACNYGPLPNCVWNSSVNMTGPYCASGTTSIQKSAPPVGFCEHPDAISNYTLCMKLKNEYMMPCKWGNASSNATLADNCTFNPSAVFGLGDLAANEKEFEVITSEYSCMAAGGNWKSEYYLENGALKQEKWCEKGAMFDLSSGTAFANKGNCDLDCWACEFQANGTTWQNVANASSACIGSALGYCRWTNDTSASNGLGWCDYPNEMSYGAGDCQTSCKDCDLQQNAYSACVGSVANCKWVNDTTSSTNQIKVAIGKCVGQNKKVCEDDCFSCYSFAECNSSSVNCQWDGTNSLCKPSGFDGEICFDGVDNDGDSMMDCGDPDCSFDTGCGGSSFGDCAQYSYDSYKFASVADAIANCTDAIAFGNLNCSWYNMSWEDIGHCGMPGEDCWTYDNNMSLCGLTTGCTNSSSFGGFGDFCDMNMTKTQDSQCWQYQNNATTTGCEDASSNCKWVTSEWGGENGGWCDYWLFAQCMSYDNNSTACNADGNCTWYQDEWMDHGYCSIACMNMTMSSSEVCEAVPGGVCEWKDSSTSVCMPSTFDMMSGGTGGKTGCPQYDGNYTACTEKNYTCTWMADTNIDNNVSGEDGVDGWCMGKGTYDMVGDMKGDMIFLGMDAGNINGGAEAGIIGWADIKGFGMRVSDKAYGFGVGVHNLTDGAVCNGYNLNFVELSDEPAIGSGLNITKMVWYLDTDGDSTTSTHCNYNASLINFEFYIKYIVQNNSNTGNIETTTKLYQCVQNSSGWQWNPTNVFVSADKKFTCYDSGMGAVFVSVEKETFENFDLFNITVPMRIFAVSYDGPGSGDGVDEVGPGYYTPGSVDFGFVDCSNPDTKDPKCKNFQKFGFNTGEDCKNGVDDDSDGLTDCDDAKCVFSPACGGTFVFGGGANDNQAPVVVFSSVDKMHDSAIVMFDTNEPANGTLMFYKNSSTCDSTSLNVTLYDVGDLVVDYDDYKPFHRVSLDSDTLGYVLTNNTAYYYKVKVCDDFNNCGTSACLNFTTKKTAKNFIFKMDVPAGYTVDVQSSVGNSLYSGNFTYANASLLGAGVTKEIGIKTNTSETKNMNITVNYSDMSIKFVGVDVYKPKTLDMSGAFITDTTNDYVGMNSSSKAWQQLASDLGMGGAGDYIELNLPITYSSSNLLNWTKDDKTQGTDVSDYVVCSNGGSSNTLCKVPTSLGFSLYNLVVPSSSSPGTTGSSGSGGGGAGIISKSNVTTDETNDNEEASDGEDKGVGETIKDVAGEIGKIIKDKTWIWILSGIVLVVVIGGVVLMKRNPDPYFSKSKFSNKVKVAKKKMDPNKILIVKNNKSNKKKK